MTARACSSARMTIRRTPRCAPASTLPAVPGEWNQEPGQQSAAIQLAAGGIYYIEARHKQAFGGDHLQVAWQGPGMAEKQIIPGTWLAPYHQQYAPWAVPQTFDVREASAAETFVGQILFHRTESERGNRVL